MNKLLVGNCVSFEFLRITVWQSTETSLNEA